MTPQPQEKFIDYLMRMIEVGWELTDEERMQIRHALKEEIEVS